MVTIVILAISVTICIGAWIWLKCGPLCDNQVASFGLPPGPWGFPIVGHLPFLGKNPGVKFMKWAKIHGPIFYIKFGGIPTVVLNDSKIIKEAYKLDNFSGRPLHPNFLQSSDMKGIFFVDGPRQTEQRKFVIQAFKNDGLTKSDLEFRIEREIVNFLKVIASECRRGEDGRSEKFRIHHFFQFPVINSIWVSVMGWRFNEGDPTLKNFSQLLKKSGDTSGSVLAIVSWFFPWAAHALAFFGKNETVNGLQTIYGFIGRQIEKSRENYVGSQPKSLAHAYFDQVALTADDSNSSFYKGQEQRFTIGDIFIAAVDATSVSLDWLLLHMVREPRVQIRLQQEIDEVLGLEPNREPRPPTISDRPRMPYTEAVIQELLRISSIGPIGIFRRSLQDVNFHGYRIPKDTMILSNLYGIHHDPEIWPEPELFQPERFLNREGSGINNIEKSRGPINLPFGSGKRGCIGEGFARDQLFLITTHFFQKFTVSCCSTDKKPSVESVFGIVVSPLPFEMRICARNISSCSEIFHN